MARSLRRVVPSLEEFLETCDSAFGFLEEHGFERSEPPAHRAWEPFQRWYTKGPLSLVIRGEGHGTMASVHFEAGGRRLAVIHLVPKADRPDRRDRTQVEQLLAAGQWVERHCRDLLEGDLTRFRERAQPLPPYLRPPGS